MTGPCDSIRARTFSDEASCNSQLNTLNRVSNRMSSTLRKHCSATHFSRLEALVRLLLSMFEHDKICGTKNARRRRTVSHLCGTHSLLVWILLLSASVIISGAHVHVKLNDNDIKPLVMYIDASERLNMDEVQTEPPVLVRRNHKRRASKRLDKPALATVRILTAPSPTPAIPEKPSLEENHASQDIPEQNETKMRFAVTLSFAVVVADDGTNLNASNATSTHDDVLLAIFFALDTIITNDTEYELQSSYNETKDEELNVSSTAESTWIYTLKQYNASAKERVNSTECHVVDSNDTVKVTWVKAMVEYLIIPERRHVNESQNQDDGDESEIAHDYGIEQDEISKDDVYDPLDPLVSQSETHRSNGNQWDWASVGSTVVNATIERIDDGSILELIQHETLRVVGISEVDKENTAQCIVVDMNPTLPVLPFIDPLDLQSWDALQMLGSIIFGLTFLGTLSLCLIGRNRSKAVRVEEWTARIGDESAVNDFLYLSSQFLPPECVKHSGAAKIVTIPGTEPSYPLMHADSAAFQGTSFPFNQACTNSQDET